ncbi:hypothetical protein ACS0TY_031816 [Phlomoides rotata]
MEEPRNDQSAIQNEESRLQFPLLSNHPPPAKPPKTPGQKAVRKAFKGTAHLSNLLPTGSVLTFQFLSPIITHEGKCESSVRHAAAAALLGFCALTCFVMSFTDSFRDGRGKVRYGIATFRGLWVIDGSTTLPAEEAPKYRVRLVDVFHAVMSIMVFAAVAMFDKNVMACFYPSPSEEDREMLTALPVTVGVICSLMFVLFPSRRHGVGFPLSRR